MEHILKKLELILNDAEARVQGLKHSNVGDLFILELVEVSETPDTLELTSNPLVVVVIGHNRYSFGLKKLHRTDKWEIV